MFRLHAMARKSPLAKQIPHRCATENTTYHQLQATRTAMNNAGFDAGRDPSPTDLALI